ncbi:MAG: hypothetical protein J5518_04890 [Lachnospiraceae bacterium]|nr:hypothetical protein [Lachnospiraceae bacterium]
MSRSGKSETKGRQPVPTGEYAVGTTTYTVYNDREEVLAPGTMRSIPARIYYPVSRSSVEGMPKARYMSKDMAMALKKSMHAPINYEKSEAAGENIFDCYADAPKIPGAKFPLIVFNHAFSSYREANSFLCIELASHGYVVLSVSHPYDATCSEADDGTKILMSRDAGKKQYEPFLPGVLSVMKLTKSKGSNRELAEKFDRIQKKYCAYINQRLNEWVKDTLSAVRYAKEKYSDLIDFDCGIGVTGHSMGGATAYLLCLDHDEYVCGANLDGAIFGDHMGKIMRKPFLQISCRTNFSAETRPYIDHAAVVYGALFEKMQHLGFSDMKHMVPIKALVGKLDADILHENVCRLHLYLFDTCLKKMDRPMPDGSENVTITVYRPDAKSSEAEG